MLEAVCIGQLAQLSQHGPSEAKVEADTVAGQLALPWRKKKKMFSGHWLESSSCSVVLPVPVSGIKKGLGKGLWRTYCQSWWPGLTFRQHNQQRELTVRIKTLSPLSVPHVAPGAQLLPKATVRNGRKGREIQKPPSFLYWGEQSDVTEFSKCVTKWGNVYQFIYFYI